MTAVTIRPYRAADRDALYEICLKTGASGADATDIYADPRLLGEVYVGPYIELEPELAFVVTDDDGVSGYVVGARDSHVFEERCAKAWWPELRLKYPENAFPEGSKDSRMVALIHRPDHAPDDLVRDYPSHLHIDLLPRTQGQGYGRELMARLLSALRAAGSTGVHLGVGATNARAIGFYERMGFDVLKRYAGGQTMGLRL